MSAEAKALGLESDPSQLAVIGIAVAQEAGVDPQRRGPHLWFHELTPPRPGRGRTHVDISVPADVAETRVAAAVAAGGRIADDSAAPKWWTLASPDNHGVDLAAWADSTA